MKSMIDWFLLRASSQIYNSPRLIQSRDSGHSRDLLDFPPSQRLAPMQTVVQPQQHVVLRLPSGTLKVVLVSANT